MKREVIIALDFANEKETLKFIDLFQDEPLYVKVGMELFYKEGPSIIRPLKQRGYKIFLDLKLHDIPSTVKKAMKNIAQLGVDLVNVQALGGIQMMKAAIDGLNEGAHKIRPKCIAVTHLTSSSDRMLNNELLIKDNIEHVILHYAKNAYQAGLDGVVCSVLEAPIIHQTFGDKFLKVTPGIRLEKEHKNDQARVATPALAYQLNSDYIVVGRSITKARNPFEVYRKIKMSFLRK